MSRRKFFTILTAGCLSLPQTNPCHRCYPVAPSRLAVGCVLHEDLKAPLPAHSVSNPFCLMRNSRSSSLRLYLVVEGLDAGRPDRLDPQPSCRLDQFPVLRQRPQVCWNDCLGHPWRNRLNNRHAGKPFFMCSSAPLRIYQLGNQPS